MSTTTPATASKAILGAQEPKAKKRAKTGAVTAKEAMLAKLQALAGETQQQEDGAEESDESGKGAES